MSSPEATLVDYLLTLDGLKQVPRQTYIAGGVRRETVAEHSWHVAMAAWALAGYLGWTVSLGRLLTLALIHDLGELEAGDTFLYAAHRDAASRAERQGVQRLARRYPALIPELEALWDEQQAGETAEARLLKVADRLLPFLHNLASQGRTRREHGVSRAQVLGAHAFIAHDAPELFAWMEAALDDAVAKGWLTDG